MTNLVWPPDGESVIEVRTYFPEHQQARIPYLWKTFTHLWWFLIAGRKLRERYLREMLEHAYVCGKGDAFDTCNNVLKEALKRHKEDNYEI